MFSRMLISGHDGEIRVEGSDRAQRARQIGGSPLY